MAGSTLDSQNLPPEFEGYRSLTEAAKILKIHPQSLRRLIKANKVPGARIFAGMYIIHIDDVHKFKIGYDPKPGRKPIRRLL